jgi:hypothetical protein
MTAEACRVDGRTLCAGLQMVTSSRLLVNNGLYPQEASVATLCRFLPHQQLDFFTIASSPRRFVEVFVRRCQSASHLTCRVLSHRVHCHVQFIQSYKLHSYIHNIQTILIHTWLHQSPKSLVWTYPFVSDFIFFKLPVLYNGPLEFTFLSCFKPPVLNNGPLELTFLSCFKPPVLNNGPLEFTF